MTGSGIPLRPGGPCLSIGRVWHRRNEPVGHEFVYTVQQIWLDPDRPGQLFDHHRLWSHRRASPVRFRSTDYLHGRHGPLGPDLRRLVARVVGREPTGSIRMLTQPRTWGWLFNPITIYLLWDQGNPSSDPVAAVLEVTNTPWKERHHYPLELERSDEGLESRFDKVLHVSPFLDGDMRYRLRITGPESTTRDGPGPGPGRLSISIDALRAGREVVETMLEVVPIAPTPPNLGAAVRRPLPTHRVSAGIHLQALRLWRKRVPFVSHPRRRDGSPTGPEAIENSEIRS